MHDRSMRDRRSRRDTASGTVGASSLRTLLAWPARTLSVRARTTLGATLIVALAITGASFLLLQHVERDLTNRIDEALGRQLDHVSVALVKDSPVKVVRLPVDVSFSARTPDGDPIVLHQVPTSRSEAGTSAQAGDTRRPDQAHRQRPAEISATMRTERRTVQTPDGTRIIRASAPTTSVGQAIEATTYSLLIACPILLAVVAALTWFVTGRALRPVAAIRDEFTSISAHDLHRRVPIPTSRDEVHRLARTMNTTLDRLETSVRRQKQFVADASHELRSPLSTARTPLEVALAYPDRADWQSVARGTLEDLDRVQALTDDLLLLARLDAGVPTEAEPVELADLIREAFRQRAPAWLDWRIDTTDAVVFGHRGQLRRLVTNLVDNAESYGSSQASITLRVNHDTDRHTAIIEVTDDGPGIPQADRERVFERFTRLDTARSRNTGGSGLGLAIARDICAAHGGDLTVADSATGTRFVVRLPTAANH